MMEKIYVIDSKMMTTIYWIAFEMGRDLQDELWNDVNYISNWLRNDSKDSPDWSDMGKDTQDGLRNDAKESSDWPWNDKKENRWLDPNTSRIRLNEVRFTSTSSSGTMAILAGQYVAIWSQCRARRISIRWSFSRHHRRRRRCRHPHDHDHHHYHSQYNHRYPHDHHHRHHQHHGHHDHDNYLHLP